MPETPDRFPETEDTLDTETLAFRMLNDHLRQTFSGGRVVMTQGIQALPDETIARVIRSRAQLRRFQRRQ